MAVYRVVIEKATGDVIRAGFCDFENDGSFDAATEEVRTDSPKPAMVRDVVDDDQMTRWNGSAFVTVARR